MVLTHWYQTKLTYSLTIMIQTVLQEQFSWSICSRLNFKTFLQLRRRLLLFPAHGDHTLLLLLLCSGSSTEYSHTGGVRLGGSAARWLSGRLVLLKPSVRTHGQKASHRLVRTNIVLFIAVCLSLVFDSVWLSCCWRGVTPTPGRDGMGVSY